MTGDRVAKRLKSGGPDLRARSRWLEIRWRRGVFESRDIGPGQCSNWVGGFVVASDLRLDWTLYRITKKRNVFTSPVVGDVIGNKKGQRYTVEAISKNGFGFLLIDSRTDNYIGRNGAWWTTQSSHGFVVVKRGAK